MNADSPVAALRGVVAALDAEKVRWFLSGSLASSLHGVPRATNDADIVAALPATAIPGLVRRLGPDYYADEGMIRDAFARSGACNLIWLPTMMKIDLSPPRFAFDHAALDRRQQAALLDGEGGELAVFVASPEDTILSKLHWYRAGREVSPRQLRDIHGIIGVHGLALDRDYLHRWARQVGIDDLLQRALDAAQPTGSEPPPF